MAENDETKRTYAEVAAVLDKALSKVKEGGSLLALDPIERVLLAKGGFLTTEAGKKWLEDSGDKTLNHRVSTLLNLLQGKQSEDTTEESGSEETSETQVDEAGQTQAAAEVPPAEGQTVDTVLAQEEEGVSSVPPIAEGVRTILGEIIPGAQQIAGQQVQTVLGDIANTLSTAASSGTTPDPVVINSPDVVAGDVDIADAKSHIERILSEDTSPAAKELSRDKLREIAKRVNIFGSEEVTKLIGDSGTDVNSLLTSSGTLRQPPTIDPVQVEFDELADPYTSSFEGLQGLVRYFDGIFKQMQEEKKPMTVDEQIAFHTNPANMFSQETLKFLESNIDPDDGGRSQRIADIYKTFMDGTHAAFHGGFKANGMPVKEGILTREEQMFRNQAFSGGTDSIKLRGQLLDDYIASQWADIAKQQIGGLKETNRSFQNLLGQDAFRSTIDRRTQQIQNNPLDPNNRGTKRI